MTSHLEALIKDHLHFGNPSVASGSGRNQMVGGGVKQSGNRRPLFGNGGKMYGERENVNPFSNHFGEEKPFQNRQVREEVSLIKYVSVPLLFVSCGK